MTFQIRGQKELKARVQDAGLCTGCGACVNLCPYQAFYHDRTIVLNPCEIPSGRCWAFCPRTPSDIEDMRGRLFEPSEFTPEIGPVRGFYIARAADAEIRRGAQHGGVVSALMALALQRGLIDAAVVAEGRERFLHEAVTLHEPAEILKRGKSKFIVSPTVAEFNRTARGDSKKIGVVATPCQAFALAKMKLRPALETGDNPIDKLAFVIGLFCGYTLSWAKLAGMLEGRTDIDSIEGMEVPPGRGVLEVYTGQGTLRFPMEDLHSFVREGCRYCIDTTAEYADLSVGSARFAQRWEEERTWNQIIVRTPAGEALIALAKDSGVLEFREAPARSLETLKTAAVEKKKAALENLVSKSGSRDDLIYLDARDPVLAALRQGGAHV